MDAVTHIDMTGRVTTDTVLDAPPVTQLEALADELGPIAAKTVELVVDCRPGFTVVYELPRDGAQLAGWRKAAMGGAEPDDVNEALWHRVILVAQCRKIRRQNVDLVDGTGKPVTFYSTDLWGMLKVPQGAPDGAAVAVQNFYGRNDFDVSAVASKLLADGGLGKAARVADPTSGPSTV